jgi:transposase
MTDDELEARLRRLDARPAADWQAMAAAVRDGYDREVKRRAIVRRRRIGASVAGALAMAAALALWLHGHHAPRATAGEPIETFHVFEDLEPGEMIEELSPADVDRVAKAFNKGA